MSNLPIVSIIIPNWNRGDLLLDTVKSCLKQEGVELDLIVIDDGSTDDSIKNLKAKYPQVKRLSQYHRGACHARNLGMDNARGDYIKFVDSDDLLHENILREQVEQIRATNSDVVYGDFEMFGDLDSPKVAGQPMRVTGEVSDPLIALLEGWWCAPFCYLFKREVLTDIRWAPELSCLQDYDFLLQVACSGVRFKYAEGINGYYRVHNKQITNSGEMKYAENNFEVMARLRSVLTEKRNWSGKAKELVLNGYWSSACAYFKEDKKRYNEVLSLIKLESPDFVPSIKMTKIMTWFIKVFGMNSGIQLYSVLYRFKILLKA